jgi:hypothetical protein
MRSLLPGLLVWGWLYAGCSGASPGSGRELLLRIQNAQYIPGPIDTNPRDPAPAVVNISTKSNELFPGVANKIITGSVGPQSTALLIGLQGDMGHWIVPVQDIDYNAAGNYTFQFLASFSPEVPDGDLLLVLRATTRDGQVGPAWLQPMTLGTPQVQGALVISLDWDTQADLDLHVQLPSNGDAGANEIWSRKPSGLVLAGAGATPTIADGKESGYLDFDSNSQCVIDGRKVENVVFPTTAPSGRYVVRVDTFSLCAESTARWRLRIFQDNGSEPVWTPVFGQSTEIDTRFPHGQGRGVQAFVFEKP